MMVWVRSLCKRAFGEDFEEGLERFLARKELTVVNDFVVLFRGNLRCRMSEACKICNMCRLTRIDGSTSFLTTIAKANLFNARAIERSSNMISSGTIAGRRILVRAANCVIPVICDANNQNWSARSKEQGQRRGAARASLNSHLCIQGHSKALGRVCTT